MITLTEVPTSNIQDNFTAVKLLTATNTSYCKRTNQVGTLQKYDNPFQSINDGCIFDSYDSKIENGGLVGSFNLATGTFVVPISGWYYIQMQMGWSLNGLSQYSFTSSNANTLGQYWVLGATDIGTLQISNCLYSSFGVVSGILSNTQLVRSQNTSSVYLYTNVLAKLNVGNEIRMVYTNNTDIEMFGGNNSNISIKGVRISG